MSRPAASPKSLTRQTPSASLGLPSPHVSRSNSQSSGDSSDSDSSAIVDTMELGRCLRCQRTLSDGLNAPLKRDDASDLAWSTNGDGRVRFGHNLYYCARCANMAGLKG